MSDTELLRLIYNLWTKTFNISSAYKKDIEGPLDIEINQKTLVGLILSIKNEIYLKKALGIVFNGIIMLERKFFLVNFFEIVDKLNEENEKRTMIVFKTLLDYGYTYNSTSLRRGTSFVLNVITNPAIKNDKIRLQFLIELIKRSFVRVNIKNGREKNTLLIEVMLTDSIKDDQIRLQIVKELLRIRNVNLNIQNLGKNTALMGAIVSFAIRNEQIRLIIVKELLKGDIDVNLQTSSGYTALAMVIAGSVIKDDQIRLDIIKELLKKENINVNLQDIQGHTPLMWSISINTFINKKITLQIIKELMKNKSIDVNIRSNNGVDALGLAIKTMKDNKLLLKIVNILLTKGAIVQPEGITLAKQSNRPQEIIDLLESNTSRQTN